MNIISASRRTDIPAFYGDWFMNRIKDKNAYAFNPYNRQVSKISLDNNDVLCLVFWSKNFIPFTENLKILKDLGYRFYFNYTITGLPSEFECSLVETDLAIKNMIELSKLFSPKHINWRYDPIVISNKTDYEFHEKNFTKMAKVLGDNGIERCYFSFMNTYAKIKPNIDLLEKNNNIKIEVYSNEWNTHLAKDLAEIAKDNGIKMYTCCGDYLISDLIHKAHCIDSDIINELFGNVNTLKEKPTRIGCGCFESIDIGTYDTCPHGCMYCYANINKESAKTNFYLHDSESKILGIGKEESEIMINNSIKIKTLF